MEPLRYRCALIPALLLAGLIASPQQASAQGAFKGDLKSAMSEVADLIEMGVQQDRPRADIRRLDDALHELTRVMDDRRSGQGRFGDGMRQTTAGGGKGGDHQRGAFAGGLKSATAGVADLIGMGVERDLSRADVGRLDKALHDLVGVFDDQRPQGRVAHGARYLSQPAGQKDFADQKAMNQPNAPKGPGDNGGKRDEKTKLGANPMNAKDPPGLGNGGGGVRKDAGTQGFNPGSGGVRKDAGKQGNAPGAAQFDHIQAKPSAKNADSGQQAGGKKEMHGAPASKVGGLVGNKSATGNTKTGPQGGVMPASARTASGNQQPASIKNNRGAAGANGKPGEAKHEARGDSDQLAKHKTHDRKDDRKDSRKDGQGAQVNRTPNKGGTDKQGQASGDRVGQKSAGKQEAGKQFARQDAGNQPGQLVGNKAAGKKNSTGRQDADSRGDSKNGSTGRQNVSKDGSTKQVASKNGSTRQTGMSGQPGNLVGNKAASKNGKNGLAKQSDTQHRQDAGSKTAGKTGPANGGGAGAAKTAQGNHPASHKGATGAPGSLASAKASPVNTAANKQTTAKNGAGAHVNHTPPASKTGAPSARTSPVNTVGNMAGTKQTSRNAGNQRPANNPVHIAQARTGPVNQAVAKHAPSNVSAGRKK